MEEIRKEHYHFNIGEKGRVAFHVETVETKKEARYLLLDTLESWLDCDWSNKARHDRIFNLHKELVAEAEVMWEAEVLVDRDRNVCDQLTIEYFACTCESPIGHTIAVQEASMKEVMEEHYHFLVGMAGYKPYVVEMVETLEEARSLMRTVLESWQAVDEIIEDETYEDRSLYFAGLLDDMAHDTDPSEWDDNMCVQREADEHDLLYAEYYSCLRDCDEEDE